MYNALCLCLQVRLSDAGNYTCGAQNVASRRLSDVAELIVFGKCKLLPFKSCDADWWASKFGNTYQSNEVLDSHALTLPGFETRKLPKPTSFKI